MIFSVLQARSLRSAIEQHRDGPEGRSGPFLGSQYGLVVKEAVAALLGLRVGLATYQQIGHPEAAALQTEITALETLLAQVRLPGAY